MFAYSFSQPAMPNMLLSYLHFLTTKIHSWINYDLGELAPMGSSSSIEMKQIRWIINLFSHSLSAACSHPVYWLANQVVNMGGIKACATIGFVSGHYVCLEVYWLLFIRWGLLGFLISVTLEMYHLWLKCMWRTTRQIHIDLILRFKLTGDSREY